MKCPKCGKEIADDSLFCEFCGTKVVIPKDGYELNKQSESSNFKYLNVDNKKGFLLFFVLLIIFFFSCHCGRNAIDSIPVSVYNMEDLLRRYQLGHLWSALVNLCIFLIFIILAICKKIRKSASLALCIFFVSFSIGDLYAFFSSYIDGYVVRTPSYFHYYIEYFAICVAVAYVIYLLIAKWKNIKF